MLATIKESALKQTDILSLIVDALDSPRSLASLACTSSFVSTIALDKLWSRISNLYPLANVMKDDLVVRYDQTYKKRGRTVDKIQRRIVRTLLVNRYWSYLS
jgi:hypothetical protein